LTTLVESLAMFKEGNLQKIEHQ